MSNVDHPQHYGGDTTYETIKVIDPSKVDLLDHGFVRLVDSMGSDLSVVRAARVSYDAAWRAGEDEKGDARLIGYLWRNKHTTPFEAVTFTFEVMAPIFVFRQWHRHRTWAYNELSARYRELPEVYYLPDPAQIGSQATTNKQGRDLSEVDALIERRTEQVAEVKVFCKRAFTLYRELLADGWPRELARSVLPVNTYSHMFGTVSLLNLMKLMSLRSDPHAQYEIRVYSDAMIELARKVVPVCIAAWESTFGLSSAAADMLQALKFYVAAENADDLDKFSVMARVAIAKAAARGVTA